MTIEIDLIENGESGLSVRQKLNTLIAGAVGGAFGTPLPPGVGDTTPPAVPTGLTVTSAALPRSTMLVEWDLNTESDFSFFDLQVRREFGHWVSYQTSTDAHVFETLANTNYSLRVRAVDRSGNASEFSEIVNHLTAHDEVPPATPIGVSAIGGLSAIWLTWTANGEEDLARYEVYESSTTTTPVADVEATYAAEANNFTRGGLADGVTRHFWVRAVDTSGNRSAWSTRVEATTVIPVDGVPPATPTGLALSSTVETLANGLQRVKLVATCTANSEPDLAGYMFEIKEGAGNYVGVSTNTNRYEWPLVKPGVTYSVRVSAYDQLGNKSAPTSAVDHTVGGDTVAPATPTGLVVEAGFGFFALRWAQNTDADLAYYEVYQHTASTPAPTSGSAATYVARGNALNVSGLAPNTTRHYWVRAVDTSGNKSAWSSRVQATTVYVTIPNITPSTVGTPGVPALSSSTALSSDGTALTTLTATWTAASNAVSYEIGITEGAANEVFFAVGSLAYAFTARAGVAYAVRVRGINELGGKGNWTTAATLTPAGDATAPDTPSGLAASPGFNTIWLSWSPVSAADLSHYEIYIASASTPAPVAGTAPSHSTKGTAFAHQGLPNAAQRWYWLRAVDMSGNKSAWSVSVNATTTTVTLPDITDDTLGAAGVPTLSPTLVTDAHGNVSVQIEATWTAASNAASYEVGVKEGAGNEVFFPVGDLLFRFVGRPGILYTVRVRPVSKLGAKGSWTTAATVTPTGDTTAPSAPTALSATAGFNALWLAWANPAVGDFSHVEVYENTTNNSGTATLIAAVPGTSFTRGGLGTGVTRYYWLKAVDTSGNKSAFSAVASGTTTSITIPDITEPVLGAAGLPSLSSSVVTDGQGNISVQIEAAWTAASNAVSYEVGVKEGAGNEVFFPVGDLLFRFAGRPAVLYTVRVRAVGKLGAKGSWTSTATITPAGDTTAPAAPTSPAAAAGLDTIWLSWTNPVVADLSHVEIYENTTNNSGTATKIATARGTTFARTGLPLEATRYYWLKAVDTSGNASGFSTATSATTGSIPEDLQLAVEGILFTPAQSGGNRLTWTAGTITYGPNGETPTAKSIVAGFTDWVSGTTYVYYVPGNTALSTSSSLTTVYSSNGLVVGIYKGGTNFQLIEGRAALDGALILAQTIGANQLVTNAAVITGAAQIANAIINTAHVDVISAAKLEAGTALAGSITVAGTALSTVRDNAANGQTAFSKFSGAGGSLPAGNVEFNFAGSSSKGGNATNTDAVGAQSASAVATAVVNFNANNDRISTTPANPVVATDGTAVDHTISTDGSANISFEWTFTGSGNAYDIDGFIVYVRQSTSSSAYAFGSAVDEEQVYYVTPEKRAFIVHGVPADRYYTFGVQAYRIVDTDIDASGAKKSGITKSTRTEENPYRPSATVAFAGDISGTLNGSAVATVVANAALGAQDPVGRINAGTTQIDPGKIVISGATSLADWRKAGDLTRIDGGALSANTVDANKITIGQRGIKLVGIQFEHNSPATNQVSWTAGAITYINDAGASTSVNITASNATWSSGTLYLYWVKDATTISTTTTLATAQASNAVILAAYKGGTDLVADYGRTVIDGAFVKTGTLEAIHVKANSLTANELAIGDFTNLVPDAQIIGSTSWTRQSFWSSPEANSEFNSPGVFRYAYQAGATGYGGYVASKVFPVVAGETYLLSFQLKELVASNDAQHHVYYRFYWLDANKVFVGYTNVAAYPTDTALNTYSDKKVVTPANARYAQVFFYVFRIGQTGDVLVGSPVVQRMNAGNLIVNGGITAVHVGANQIITQAANIADAIITSAKILSLDAGKLQAGTALAGSITVSGTALSTIETRAADPATRINAGTTQIDPGKIVISGGTSLADWRMGGDLTKIDGGALSANTVSANKMTIGQRGIDTAGIQIEHNSPATNQVSWTSGSIAYINDAGSSVAVAISAGNATWTSGTLWIYWTKGATTLSTTTSQAVAQTANTVVLAIYQGGTNLIANYGRTVIDGAFIKTGTVEAIHVKANSLTAYNLAIGDFTNYVESPYFESAASWQTAAGFTFSTGAGIGHGVSTTALTVENVAGGWAGIGNAVIFPVSPGDELYLEAVGRRIDATQSNMSADVFWLNESKVWVNSFSVSWTPASSTSYETKSAVGVAPANAKYARVMVRNASASAMIGSYRMGYVKVMRRVTGSLIVNGGITAVHVGANQIITQAANIADAIITSAKILSLDAGKLQAGTALAGSITVSGTALSTIETRAADPATRINAGTTQIDPGKIVISGATSLADWRKAGDLTRIDGGALSANTVDANKITIGQRGIKLVGIQFEHNSPATNQVSWTAGAITYINDAGASTSVNITASNATWSSGTLYLYWVKDATTISTTTTLATAQASNAVILAAYKGGTDLVADYGRTVIDGAFVKTGTLEAIHVKANSLTANELAIGDFTNLVPDAQIIGSTSWTRQSFWSSPEANSEFNSPGVFRYAYQAGATGYGGYVASKVFPVVAGETYLLSFQLKELVASNDAQHHVYYRFYWLDANKVFVGYTNVAAYPTDTALNTYSDKKVVTPANARYAQVFFYVFRIGQTGDVLVGSPVVQRMNAGNLIVNGGITAVHVGANQIITQAANIADAIITSAKILSLDAGKLQAGTALAGSITVSGRSLGTVVDDTFHDDMSGQQWGKYAGTGSVSVQTGSGFPTGNAALILTGPTGACGPDLIPFDSTKLYKVTFRVWKGTGSGTLYAGLQSYDNARAFIAENHLVANGINIATMTNAWVEYVAYVRGTSASGSAGHASTIASPYTVRDGAKFIRPHLYANWSAGTGDFAVDMVRIEVVNEDAAAVVNAGSTKIDPGKILISGATTLSNWIKAGDTTKIDGGQISANTILANSAIFGLRGLAIDSLQFEHNSPSANSVSWTAGTITYTNDAGATVTQAISASNAAWTTGTLYIYYVQGATTLSTTTVAATANAANAVILATYKGGTNLVSNYGRTVIDGATIKTGTITATQADIASFRTNILTANVITATMLQSNIITARHMVIGSNDNLVPNGDWADGSNPLDYLVTPTGSGTVSYSTSVTKTGGRSLLLAKTVLANSVTTRHRTEFSIPVTPGEVLFAETEVITDGTATTVGFYYRVLFYQTNKTTAASPAYVDVAGNQPVGTTWTPYSKQFTVPSNAAWASVQIYNHSTQTTTANFYIDRMVLRRANGASLIVDGSIKGQHLDVVSARAAILIAGSVQAEHLAISQRGISVSGLSFDTNNPATNQVSWTAGTIAYIDDAGATATAAISAAYGTWTTGTLYIYWVKGATTLSSTTTLATAMGANNVIVASYKGGSDLTVEYGGTTISGNKITTGVIQSADGKMRIDLDNGYIEIFS